MTTRVLLVDDHELIRQGLARAFERDAAMSVVGQAGSVADALAAWKALRPDVVVTDLQLPDGTGLDVIRAIRRESADAGLVMLTMHASDAQILDAMEAGASAFLGKEARGTEVVGAAAHAAKAPRSFLCTGLAGAVMRRSTIAATRLSGREQQVLDLLADGLGSAEIARQLYLGESTVKTHISRIYQKLGANNRAQALVAAMRLGLLFDRVSSSSSRPTPDTYVQSDIRRNRVDRGVGMHKFAPLRARREERGAAAVEFALVVPILLLVVFGIINFGFVLAQQISLNNGARQAARFGVVDGRNCGQIKAEARNAAETIGMTGTQVPTPVVTGCGADTVKPCTGSASGANVTVTMSRVSTWVVAFPPFTSGNAPTLVGRGVMRCEFS